MFKPSQALEIDVAPSSVVDRSPMGNWFNAVLFRAANDSSFPSCIPMLDLPLAFKDVLVQQNGVAELARAGRQTQTHIFASCGADAGYVWELSGASLACLSMPLRNAEGSCYE